MTDIAKFHATAHAAEEWINELTRQLGWSDRKKAPGAFTATVQALRDSLPAQEAIFLGDQGWRLAKYSALKERESLLERIREDARDPGIDAENVARVVLAMLAEHLPASELDDAKAVTPKELRAPWPS
jgi:uncharacterized protein (DUF2267 family)